MKQLLLRIAGVVIVVMVFTMVLIMVIINYPTKSNHHHHKPVIIGKDFRSYDNNRECNYTYMGLGFNEHSFQDSCNKYNIGDTLK